MAAASLAVSRLPEASMGRSWSINLSITSHHRIGVLDALGGRRVTSEGLHLLPRTGLGVSHVVNVFPVVSALLVAVACVTDCARRILAGQEHEVKVWVRARERVGAGEGERVGAPAFTKVAVLLRLAVKALASILLLIKLRWRQPALFLGLPLVVTVLKARLKMGQLSSLVLCILRTPVQKSWRHQTVLVFFDQWAVVEPEEMVSVVMTSPTRRPQPVPGALSYSGFTLHIELFELSGLWPAAPLR
ncbi:hypothetical protein EYF80_001469 [Liparis tanakae]|uniref:Uncharacterized protein n=1 Tax=Liparis tanakae TaxID=230148 RepID=A0A4Z2JEN8_9TELE|nr:hypothetical protein EYF80_001469 [Liparis tanakae]